MRVRPITLTAASGMLAVLVASSAAPQAAGNPEPPPPPPSSESLASSLPGEYKARAVEKFVHDSNALGHYYDESAKKFAVRIPSTGPGSGISRSSLDNLNAPIRLESSSVSHAEVAASLDAIKKHAQGSGVGHAYDFFYHPTKDRVRLGTDAPYAELSQLIASHPVIEYRKSSPGPRSRQYDTAPHWGGASISNNTSICSSGFSVVAIANGVRRMATAGHCYWELGGSGEFHSTGGGGTFGIIGTAPRWQNDVGYIGGSTYGAYIYVGGATGTAMHVDGAANPSAGARIYCMSGQTSYEHCGLYVHTINGNACYASGECYGGLIVTSPQYGQDGDSGGPLYAYTTDRNHVHIRGLFIATNLQETLDYFVRWTTVASYGYGIVR